MLTASAMDPNQRTFALVLIMDENQNQSFAFSYHNTSFRLRFLTDTILHLNINDTAFSCREGNISSLSEFWKDPYMVILRVEILVIIAAALHVILVLFGSHRRRSGSSFLNLILFMAYTIPNLLVPYTIGLMESAEFHNSLFVVWTMFLIQSLGGACSISAYTLDDNEHWKRRKIVQLVQLFWAFWLLLRYAHKDWKVALPLAIILVLSGLRMADTREAFRLATLSDGVASNTKLVADFMQQENDIGGGEFDPVTMRGYNYLVAGEEKEKVDEASPPEHLMKLTITGRVITIDKIWSLTSVEDPGVRMKDTCLSFALYKLLRRRFAGYRMAEAGRPETLDFVLRGLLSGDKEGERTFRVIEVELAFLYDSFYTTYPVIFSRWFKMLAKSCLLLLVSLWVAVALLIYHLDEIEGEYHTIFDVIVSYALVLSMMALELCQIIAFVLSDWAKLLTICKFVKKPSLHGNLFYEMIFRFLCRRRRILSWWNGRLGQYSLVDSYNYCPCKLHLCMQGLFLMDKTRKGQKAGRQIKLPKEVKKAIASSLEATCCKLSNGLSSLSRNGVSDSLSWACRFETLTHTHTIFVEYQSTD